MWRISAILFAISLAVISSQRKRVRYIKLNKLYCTTGDTFISLHSCKLAPINRYISYIHFEGQIEKDLGHVFVKGKLYKQDYTMDYKLFLMNITLDVCKIIERSEMNYYGTIIFNEFKRSTDLNIYNGCPIRAAYVRATNFSISPALLTKFPVPYGNYKLIIQYFDKIKGSLKFVFGIEIHMYQGFYYNKKNIDEIL